MKRRMALTLALSHLVGEGIGFGEKFHDAQTGK